MISDFFRLASNNLKRRRLRAWLTMLGIFIGITAVVSLISLGNGLTDVVNAQFGVSSTEMISVQAGGLNAYGPPGSGAVTPLDTEDLEAIQRIPGVERAFRRNIPPGKLEFNDIVGFGYATNVPSGDDREFFYEAMELEVETGRLLKDGDSNKVMLGYNFYDNKAGFQKSIYPGDTVLLQDEDFEVVGIVEQQGSFILDNVVYVNEKPLEELIGYGEEIDIIAVKVKDKRYIDEVKEDIEKSLRKTRDVDEGEEDFEVSTPEAALETVNSVLGGVQIFVAIIASISIIVGAIGISNTMYTSVLERKKEIGTMKAIGAKNSDIMFLFLVESGLMGLIGSVVGVIVGEAIGYAGTSAINNWLGSSASPTINFGLIGLTLLGGFLIGCAAGLFPAFKAAKENPVEALRG
jgi:putative ABC transport system permease protein